jgi:hypothetical protein
MFEGERLQEVRGDHERWPFAFDCEGDADAVPGGGITDVLGHGSVGITGAGG